MLLSLCGILKMFSLLSLSGLALHFLESAAERPGCCASLVLLRRCPGKDSNISLELIKSIRIM